MKNRHESCTTVRILDDRLQNCSFLYDV